jgi:hypothetical protein
LLDEVNQGITWLDFEVQSWELSVGVICWLFSSAFYMKMCYLGKRGRGLDSFPLLIILWVFGAYDICG